MDRARAVIIGGGVGGTSIAYHLAELGWTDAVLLQVRTHSRVVAITTARGCVTGSSTTPGRWRSATSRSASVERSSAG